MMGVGVGSSKGSSKPPRGIHLLDPSSYWLFTLFWALFTKSHIRYVVIATCAKFQISNYDDHFSILITDWFSREIFGVEWAKNFTILHFHSFIVWEHRVPVKLRKEGKKLLRKRMLFFIRRIGNALTYRNRSDKIPCFFWEAFCRFLHLGDFSNSLILIPFSKLDHRHIHLDGHCPQSFISEMNIFHPW